MSDLKCGGKFLMLKELEGILCFEFSWSFISRASQLNFLQLVFIKTVWVLSAASVCAALTVNGGWWAIKKSS